MSKTFTSRPGVVRNQNTNDRNQTGAVPKTNRGRGRVTTTTTSTTTSTRRGTMATGMGRGTTPSTRGTMATGMGRGTAMTGIDRGAASQNLSDENSKQEQQLDQRMS